MSNCVREKRYAQQTPWRKIFQSLCSIAPGDVG